MMSRGAGKTLAADGVLYGELLASRLESEQRTGKSFLREWTIWPLRLHLSEGRVGYAWPEDRHFVGGSEWLAATTDGLLPEEWNARIPHNGLAASANAMFEINNIDLDRTKKWKCQLTIDIYDEASTMAEPVDDAPGETMLFNTDQMAAVEQLVQPQGHYGWYRLPDVELSLQAAGEHRMPIVLIDTNSKNARFLGLVLS